MSGTDPKPFDFDQAVDAFFKSFPSYRSLIFVAPPFKYASQAVQAYRDFTEDSAFDDLYDDSPDEEIKTLLYPGVPMAFAPHKDRHDQNLGILPRWPTLTSYDEMIHNVFRPAAYLTAGHHDASDYQLDRRTTDHLNYFYFDHEIGHILTTNTLWKNKLSDTEMQNHHEETAADIYAILRHYQRFGKNSAFPEFLANLRRMDMIQQNDVVHFTAEAIEKTAKACEKIDIQALNPKKTVALALDLTPRSTLNRKTARCLKQNFAAVAGDFRNGKKLDGKALRKMERAAENTDCPLTRKTVTSYFEFIQNSMPRDLSEIFNFKLAQKRINPPKSKRKRANCKPCRHRKN
jgi:hypothetical protein